MSPKTNRCVSNLVNNSAERIDNQANSRGERIESKSNWESDQDRQAVFEEVADTSVAAVVVSNVSFVIENNDTVILTVGCLFVDELVCPEVATLHDLLLIEDWEDVKPDHA